MMTWPRSLERLADAFWWPTINLIIWGMVTVFMQQQTGTAVQFISIFLSGVMLWTIISRAQEEMGIIFLQEAWDRNLLNMFTSPLTMWEFTVAAMVLSIIKLLLSILWLAAIGYLLYAFSLFQFGLPLVLCMALLMLSGWSLGLIINGLIIQYGFRVQALAWTLALIFQPFSAVYYPVSSMPQWMQSVARFLPTSYIFEGMRSLILDHQINIHDLITAGILNIVYLSLGIWYFKRSFDRARQSGQIMKFS